MMTVESHLSLLIFLTPIFKAQKSLFSSWDAILGIVKFSNFFLRIRNRFWTKPVINIKCSSRSSKIGRLFHATSGNGSIVLMYYVRTIKNRFCTHFLTPLVKVRWRSFVTQIWCRKEDLLSCNIKGLWDLWLKGILPVKINFKLVDFITPILRYLRSRVFQIRYLLLSIMREVP